MPSPRRPARLPLFDWTPPAAAPLPPRRRRIMVAGVVGLMLLGLGSAIDPRPRLSWNASASAPIGLWRIHPGAPLQVGDMVLAETPAGVRQLVARRRYIPANVPLLKRIAATDGDTVCATGAQVMIDGRPVARRLAIDGQGRSLPWWIGCERLAHGRLFLLMPARASFDGRYFGPVDRAAVIGRATPLWLR